MNDPLEFFRRYNLTPRPQQEKVLREVQNAWASKKYFILQCPTGTGKTYIADAIASSVTSAYLLTATLQLQDQYEKSWDEIVNLKGRSNYRCGINPSFRVDGAPCTLKKDLVKTCREKCICPYYKRRDEALAAQAFLTNPLFLLYSAHCGFASGEQAPAPRNVMIVDESHMLEDQLISFSESDIDPAKISQMYGIDVSGCVFSNNEAHNRRVLVELHGRVTDKCDALKKEMADEFGTANISARDLGKWAEKFGGDVANRVNELNKKIYSLDKVLQPINIFFQNQDGNRWIVAKYHDKNVLKLSPYTIDFVFNRYFSRLADKFIFMSATMPSKQQFCKEFGIPESECVYIDMPSPFDPERSPITIVPCLNLAKKNFDTDIRRVGSTIDAILDEHKNERGIIHAVTYNIASNIFQQVSDDTRSRLICKDAYPHIRFMKNSELIERHEEDTTGRSILLSPSMTEGVDLKDDLARFQIIMKLPWASLGDIRTAKKMEMDGDWYNAKMFNVLLQACGRAVRSEEDHAVTYILDKNFAYFWNKKKHELPKWFNQKIYFV